MKPKHKFPGFTLIELLLVMSVISVLIAIVIPSFKGMQNEVYETRAQNDLSAIRLALESYYKNTRSYPSEIATNNFIIPPVLTSASPPMLDVFPEDYFKSAQFSTPTGTKYTYRYALFSTSGNLDYYISSSGPNGQPEVSYNAGKVFSYGDDIVATNVLLKK